jgi:hypothetical protein
VSGDLIVTTEVHTVVEQDTVVEVVTTTELDFIVETQVDVLETSTTDVVLEQVASLDFIDATEDALVITVGIQGPSGPQGAQGLQGEPGLPGESNVGGFGVDVTDPQPGEVLAFFADQTWKNEDVLDGGNF